MRSQLFCVVLAICMVPVCATAASTIVIPGNANIFGAGHAAPPPIPSTPFNDLYPDESGPGVLPPGISFTPDPYLILRFDSVVGSGPLGGVAYNGGVSAAGPEGFTDQPYGADLLSTNVSSTAGISGISMTNRVLFLVGVFLGPTEPVIAPPALNYDGANSQVNFAPALGQTFFIGDGFTDSAVQQNFYVPTGATRLFLGFVDGWQFQGAPSWYGDNRGELTATLHFDSYTPGVPDPATIWLVAAPLAVVWYRARRRRA